MTAATERVIREFLEFIATAQVWSQMLQHPLGQSSQALDVFWLPSTAEESEGDLHSFGIILHY
jgi:hypothetical protein